MRAANVRQQQGRFPMIRRRGSSDGFGSASGTSGCGIVDERDGIRGADDDGARRGNDQARGPVRFHANEAHLVRVSNADGAHRGQPDEKRREQRGDRTTSSGHA